jgi:hypothetical protein
LDSFVHHFPFLPLLSFLLPLLNYSLVSSSAGRSFFEKTTERVLDPHTPARNTDLSPIPTGDTRPYSYVFSPRLVHTLDLHLQMLFLSSYLQIPALIPCMYPICYLVPSYLPIACISLLLSSNSRSYTVHVPKLLPFIVISTYSLHISPLIFKFPPLYRACTQAATFYRHIHL